jgi:hypothetical protein
VILTNVFGTAPLTIGAASVGLRDNGEKIIAGSAHTITFAGRTSVTIPPGAIMYSDSIDIAVPALKDFVIDLFIPEDLPKSAWPLTIHGNANQTNYISSAGVFTGAADLPVATKLAFVVLLPTFFAAFLISNYVSSSAAIAALLIPIGLCLIVLYGLGVRRILFTWILTPERSAGDNKGSCRTLSDMQRQAGF